MLSSSTGHSCYGRMNALDHHLAHDQQQQLLQLGAGSSAQDNASDAAVECNTNDADC